VAAVNRALRIACGALGLLVLAPGLAVAQVEEPSLEIAPTATLQAKGAAVNASVSVTCQPYTDQWGWVYDDLDVRYQLTQKVRGGRITSAETVVYDVPCDGTAQDVGFLLVPSTYAFKKGAAFASASATYSMTAPFVETSEIRLR
jgi:hypothetical protein